jgi:hypothetical protein
MYCPSCGSALSRQMKYCTRCGAQTNMMEIGKAEKRFDEYLEGLFWVTVLGLGVILGGATLLTKVLDFSLGVVVAYLVLSSIAFLTIFWLSLRETLRMAKNLKKSDVGALEPSRDTNKMLPAEGDAPGVSPQSVTENTTRSLEPAPSEHAANQ